MFGIGNWSLEERPGHIEILYVSPNEMEFVYYDKWGGIKFIIILELSLLKMLHVF
jgi:hypothetical protein